MTGIDQSIRDFVAGHVNGLTLADDARIFDTGYVNSLFGVKIAIWAREEFGLELEGDDLDITNFQTIADIRHFITAKLAGRTLSLTDKNA